MTIRQTLVTFPVAILAALIAVGGTQQQDEPTPPPVTVTVPSSIPTDTLLTNLLPYYGMPTPDGCAEDMICWIGTESDGRTPEQIIADYPYDVAASWESYGYDTTLPLPTDEP